MRYYRLHLEPKRIAELSEKRLRAMVTELELQIEEYKKPNSNRCHLCSGHMKCRWNPDSPRMDNHCTWALADKPSNKEDCVPMNLVHAHNAVEERTDQIIRWIDQLEDAIYGRR